MVPSGWPLQGGLPLAGGNQQIWNDMVRLLLSRVSLTGVFLAGVFLAGLCISAAPTWAADLDNGRILARKCSACHGKNGLARDPEVPHLAGQSALYLEKSLKGFRSGKREDRRMTLIAKPLTDSEIKDLAAWFSSFELTVVVPQ